MLRGRSAGLLLTELQNQLGSQLTHPRIQPAAVANSFPHHRYQFQRNIHAATAALFDIGENKGAVLLSAGAGWASRPNARFVHLGQRPFGKRPQVRHLSLETLERRLV